MAPTRKGWTFLAAISLVSVLLVGGAETPTWAQERGRDGDRSGEGDQRRSRGPEGRREGGRGDRGGDRRGERGAGERGGGERGEGRRGFGRDRDRSGDDDSRRGPERPPERPGGEGRPATAPASSSGSGSSAGGGIDMRSYARSLISQHDKDGDKMLKGKELEGLRGPAAQADLDNDGVITSDELVMKLSGGASASASSPPSTGGATEGGGEPPPASSPPPDAEKSDRPSRSSGGARSASSNTAGSRTLTNGERKSYRFKTPKERAPSGLPSFFSRDANGDGQISMHEYATSWNDRLAAEFIRLDLNGDGVITPKEAASGN